MKAKENFFLKSLGPWDSRSLLALVPSIFFLCFESSSAEEKSRPNSLPVLSGKKENAYQPTLALTGKYGKQRSFGLGSIMAPLFQKDGAVFYTNLRYMYDTRKAQEGNLGFGARSLNLFTNAIVGAYGFVDLSRSPFGNTFTQGTIGFEFMTADSWDARFNAYIPLSKSKPVNLAADQAPQDRFQGYDRYVSRTREHPYSGFDLEIGHIFPGLDRLRVYGAVYAFGAPGAPSLKGGRLRMRFNFNDYFALNAEVQNDNLRKTTYFAGLTVTIPLGPEATRPAGALEKRMMEAPERDIDIISYKHEKYEKAEGKYYHLATSGSEGSGTVEAPRSLLEVGRAHEEGTFLTALQNQSVTHLVHEGHIIPLGEAGDLLDRCLQMHQADRLGRVREEEGAGNLIEERARPERENSSPQEEERSGSLTTLPDDRRRAGEEREELAEERGRENSERTDSSSPETSEMEEFFARLNQAQSEEDLSLEDRRRLLAMLNGEESLSFPLPPGMGRT